MLDLMLSLAGVQGRAEEEWADSGSQGAAAWCAGKHCLGRLYLAFPGRSANSFSFCMSHQAGPTELVQHALRTNNLHQASDRETANPCP